MSIVYVVFGLFCLGAQSAQAATDPIVDLQTSQGIITLQLSPAEAPLTVANFLTYVNEGFYENTLFHRVIPNFMIQGGGFTPAMQQKPTHAPIKLESDNGLSNVRGALAMARQNANDTATAQFFINHEDNAFLDYQSSSRPGYAVFGQVIEGLAVVDSISSVSTRDDVPVLPVIIEAARVREAQVTFTEQQPFYAAGERLTLTLQENTITRERELDLWVAVLLPDNTFLYLSADAANPFSTDAKPYQRTVSLNKIEHTVLTFVIPDGIAGHYTVFAIFNEPGSDLSDLTHSLRSNLASANLDLR